MSAKPASSDARAQSGLVATLGCLDPRRWVGALLAIAGILMSIVAPLLPAALLKRLSQPAVDAPPRTRPTISKRPSPTPMQPSIVVTATGRRSRARPRTAGDLPLSPHVTFAFGPHPRSISTGSLVASSHSNSSAAPSPSLKPSPLPPTTDTKSLFPHPSPALLPPSPLSTPATLPSPSVTPLPQPSTLYSQPQATPSLDSLDLASESSHSLGHSQNAKRPFRILVPRIAFGRRKSSADLNWPCDSEAPSSGQSIIVHPPSADKLPKAEEVQEGEDEWRGSKAFAVKRSNTIATSPVSGTEPLPPLAPRRKFSLFSGKAKDDDSPTTPTAALSLSTNSSAVPPVPSLPSPATLERMVASLPPSATSSVYTPRVSALSLEGMIPLAQTTTPPPRPARTDPYKTYGVPVPGSEQARAFLKAEKERIRAEKERRERERAEAQDEQIAVPTEVKVTETAKTKTKLPPRSSRPGGSLKMCKGRGTAEKTSGVHAEEVDAGGEADAEDEKSEVPQDTTEFGVLPAVDSTPPQERPQSQSQPHVKRSWGFSRRSSDFTAEKEEKRREKERRCQDKDKDKKADKDKGRDDSKKRPKSRDGSKKSMGFRTKDRSSKGKDRGYASDTGVPSLTYKLMQVPF